MIRPRALRFTYPAVVTDVDGKSVNDERRLTSRAADFVTDGNREEGFANAVERFIPGGGRERAEMSGVGGCA